MIKVTYLSQSGFLLEMDATAFLFDYYRGEIPKISKDKHLYVFVSHAHFDHFKKKIFDLRKQYPQVTYILSVDIPTEETEHVWRIAPNQQMTLDNLKIRTLRSTDEGVAYLVKCNGKTIYHAGDLNWWHWEGEADEYNEMMKQNYQKEIDSLQNEQIDIAFLPVDVRQEEQYFWGLDYFMRNTHTKLVFPMHFWKRFQVMDQLMNQKETESYREKIVRIEKEGQEFDITCM